MKGIWSHKMVIHPCVQCGFCCGVDRHDGPTICTYGEPTEDGTICRFIEVDDEILGSYKCLIRKEIKECEKDSEYPMFDCGCSSMLFNSVRDKVIENLRKTGK